MSTNTEFVVRVSAANMPNSCWGRYVHVAVLEVEKGHVPSQIRDTKHQRVVEAWYRCNVGTTARSASVKAEMAAAELAAKLNAARAA